MGTGDYLQLDGKGEGKGYDVGSDLDGFQQMLQRSGKSLVDGGGSATIRKVSLTDG